MSSAGCLGLNFFLLILMGRHKYIVKVMDESCLNNKIEILPKLNDYLDGSSVTPAFVFTVLCVSILSKPQNNNETTYNCIYNFVKCVHIY